MLTLFVLPLILAFAPAAVWALRAGGLRRLWLLGAFALLALILVALVLSAVTPSLACGESYSIFWCL